MTNTPTVISLAAICREGNVKQLYDQLSAVKDQPVTLDAADVTTMSSLVLQVLLGAEREWQAEGNSFSISNMSDTCCQSLGLLGLEEDHFSSEVAA